MNSAERLRMVLKERKIRPSHVERALGWSNGYIAELSRDLPAGRLFDVARYLGISPEYLATGSDPSVYYQDDETAALAQRLLTDPDLRALMDAARDSSPDDMRMVADILRRVKGSNDG